uniref:Putative chymotrypsin inhibitor-like protein n=1 Tax=Anopheles darlingi TaxID=43151 RepID=A0A2M4CJU0_ANODA
MKHTFGYLIFVMIILLGFNQLYAQQIILSEGHNCVQHQKCGRNEEYRCCGTCYQPTCDQNIAVRCIQQCWKGCYCKAGFVRGPIGSCILTNRCH